MSLTVQRNNGIITAIFVRKEGYGMILIISWPVVLLLLGIWVVFSAICAIFYGIQNSWDEEKVKWLRPFTVKQKWGLFALLLAIFGGAVAFGCGLAYKEPIAGVFGFFATIVASVIAAYLCSPLKWGWESGVTLLGVLASLASLAVVVAFAWIFVLIAIFRKSTWRLYVGIVVGLGVILAGIAGGLAIYEYQETKGLYQAADNYIADGDYEAAMNLYQSMGEEERYLQTWYDYGMWYLEQGEDYKAQRTFQELAEEHQHEEAALQAKKVAYARGQKAEAIGNYDGGVVAYEEILDYEDARERYQYCSYMSGLAQVESADFEEAIKYFQQAGDYGDAKEYVLYSQAREIANKDLVGAEDLLRQLPRDFLEVDMLLTAIEQHGDLNGGYTIKKASGDDPFGYSSAYVTLMYEQVITEKTPTLEFEVKLSWGKSGIGYDSNGVMPINGILKFTFGSTYQKKFEVTKKTVKVVEIEPYSGSYTKDKKENSYIFERVS